MIWKKVKLSQVLWLQVRHLINRFFKIWSGKTAFLQPIGIFFSKTAKTVTFVNFQNCYFVSSIPRVQAVMTFHAAIIALTCFKSSPVINSLYFSSMISLLQFPINEHMLIRTWNVFRVRADGIAQKWTYTWTVQPSS